MIRRSIVAAVAVTALTVGLGGCGEQPRQPRPLVTGTPSTSPSPSAAALPAAEAAAVRELLSVFADFRDLEDQLSADPPPVTEAEDLLAAHLSGPLHSRIRLSLSVMHRNDLARHGSPASDVEVTDVDLEADPPTAVISECLDTSAWPLVNRTTRAPLAADPPPEVYGSQPGSYLRRIHAMHLDGAWTLNDYDRPLLQLPAGQGSGC